MNDNNYEFGFVIENERDDLTPQSNKSQAECKRERFDQ